MARTTSHSQSRSLAVAAGRSPLDRSRARKAPQVAGPLRVVPLEAPARAQVGSLGLGDGNRLFVGVDHEHQVRRGTHILDAAKRALELVLLARQLKQLFLGETLMVTVEKFLERLEPLVQ